MQFGIRNYNGWTAKFTWMDRRWNYGNEERSSEYLLFTAGETSWREAPQGANNISCQRETSDPVRGKLLNTGSCLTTTMSENLKILTAEVEPSCSPIPACFFIIQICIIYNNVCVGFYIPGGLAQLARAPALQAGGHRFESVILHDVVLVILI